jgi:hypothetical protein
MAHPETWELGNKASQAAGLVVRVVSFFGVWAPLHPASWQVATARDDCHGAATNGKAATTRGQVYPDRLRRESHSTGRTPSGDHGPATGPPTARAPAGRPHHDHCLCRNLPNIRHNHCTNIDHESASGPGTSLQPPPHRPRLQPRRTYAPTTKGLQVRAPFGLRSVDVTIRFRY